MNAVPDHKNVAACAAVLRVPEERLAKADRAKLQILRASIDCLAKSGFEGATVSLLAEASGFSRPLVTHYFKTKDELLARAVELIVAEAQLFVVENMACRGGGLSAYIDANFRWLERFKNHYRVWVLFLYYCTFHRSWARFNQQIREAGADRVRELLRMEHPKVSTKEIDGLAHAIYGDLYATMLAEITEARGTATGDRVKARARQLTAAMLGRRGSRARFVEG